MQLNSILAQFAGKRILVVGDVMLDEYVWGKVSRVSPEAPVMVVDAVNETQVPGGAANVVNNLCALEATGIVMGMVGNDPAAKVLESALRERGADTSGLIATSDRPTTRKVRIVAHSQQVVRVDHESREAAPAEVLDKMRGLLQEFIPGADAVILSDYQKGVLSPDVIAECVKAARLFGKPICGNLKPSALNSNCKLTLITLNLLEASQAVRAESLQTDQEIDAAGKSLLESTGADHILITRGAHGLSLYSSAAPDRPFHVPAHPVAVFDVAGSGDTVISTLTLALASGASHEDAVVLANYAAAEVVKKLGVATVTRTEIEAALSTTGETGRADITDTDQAVKS